MIGTLKKTSSGWVVIYNYRETVSNGGGKGVMGNYRFVQAESEYKIHENSEYFAGFSLKDGAVVTFELVDKMAFIKKIRDVKPKENKEEKTIGTTGEIVDLFEKELTKKEWDALAIVHKMKNRLNLGIRFDWSKSIDVRSEKTSQIVDESVFLKKQIKNK